MTPYALHLLLPLALSAVTPAVAQEMAPRPTPFADALADQVRILATNPTDLTALVSAGTLSVRLSDPAAALAFFARAQAIAPNDPRIAAGKAGALVLLERPGEALQLYQMAERAGLSMRPYLSERGLAYDLTGQPGHAQRDYRAALLETRDDETIRRLALSLGVSGKRDEAMTLLDPLLRKSDRAAWRARACIMAIGGDAAGAERIASNMMPGGAALGPFLRRLQWLPLADRAFAVHFGSLTASVARRNDARLAPAVAMLPLEPAPMPPATQVAERSPTARPNERRDRRARPVGRVQLAARTPLPTPAPRTVATPTPTPTPAQAAPQRFSPSPSIPAAVASMAATPSPAPRPPITATTARVEIFTPPRQSTDPAVGFASSAPTIAPGPAPLNAAPTSRPSVPGEATQASRQVSPLEGATRAASPAGIVTSAGATQATGAVTPAPVDIVPTPAPPPALVASPTSATPPSAVLPAIVNTEPAPLPLRATDEPARQSVVADSNPEIAATAFANSPDAPAPQPVAPPARASALDAIVGGIGIPAEELEIRRSIPPVVPTVPVQASEPKPEPKIEVKTPPKPAPKQAPNPAAKPDPKKAKADAKAKPDAKKPKPDPAKSEPERWWVQVAGGANAADLGKDWKRLSTKSPAAFRGRSAWTTPLRATNRLLVGPFKSQSEASSLVNLLAKDGSSAFAWQSSAGQIVTRLPIK